MPRLKTLFLSLSFLIYLGMGGLIHLIFFWNSTIRWNLLNILTCGLIRILCGILGVQINLEGDRRLLQQKGIVLISPHVGYIDGLVLGSLVPITFVSKQEVRHWPIIGLLIQISETILINRKDKMKVINTLQEMRTRLSLGQRLLFFPEGTSTNGSEILPFQSSLFPPVIQNHSQIIPLQIEYLKINGRPIDHRDDICWYGQVKFGQHLKQLLRFNRVDVLVKILSPISGRNYEDSSEGRKKLAEDCRERFLSTTF